MRPVETIHEDPRIAAVILAAHAGLHGEGRCKGSCHLMGYLRKVAREAAAAARDTESEEKR